MGYIMKAVSLVLVVAGALDKDCVVEWGSSGGGCANAGDDYMEAIVRDDRPIQQAPPWSHGALCCAPSRP